MQNKTQQKSYSFYNDPSINLIAQENWKADYSLKVIIKERIAIIANKYWEQELIVNINKTNQPKFGNYSSNVALVLAKKTNIAPLILAGKILLDLKADPYLKKICSKIEVAGRGFINFFINNESYLLELKRIINLNDKYGQNKCLSGKRIVFEYAHPNPFKAFHIGHLRNIILGESLIRLLENSGAEVIRVNYQGDVGMHIAKCLWAFKKISEKDYPVDITQKVKLIAECYAKGAKAFEEPIVQEEIKKINKSIYTKDDESINKLWELGKKWSLDKFELIYGRLDSTFQKQYMESEMLDLCHKFITEAQEKKILIESQGAIVFDGEPYGLETRVFLNSEGLPTYEGKELGLAYKEFTDWGKIDLCIHNVAVEQISFFKVTFKVQALLNKEMYKGRQYHNVYEFVGLKSGKMSSRKGNIVLGEDILDQAKTKIKQIISHKEDIGVEDLGVVPEIVGVGSIKYSFLNISSKSYLAFDLDKSISFEGDSGPYIQYTFARANKIISKAKEENLITDSEASIPQIDLTEKELDVLHQLEQFEEVLIETTKNLAPNLLCTYLFVLAQKYNSFYKDIPILSEENIQLKMFRLELSTAVCDILKRGLHLLGIKTVNTM